MKFPHAPLIFLLLTMSWLAFAEPLGCIEDGMQARALGEFAPPAAPMSIGVVTTAE